MDSGLSGKNALISGGGTGIGRAIAMALANEGANVAIGSNRAEDEVLSEIEARGVQALHVPADVSVEGDVINMVDAAIMHLGSIDLYVNNAAITIHQPITRISSVAWLKTINTNLSACVWACREICRHMILRSGGIILIIGSTAQFNQAYGEASYHISKTGLRVFKKYAGHRDGAARHQSKSLGAGSFCDAADRRHQQYAGGNCARANSFASIWADA